MDKDITEMNFDDLKNHFRDYNRDQLLLALQTREIQISNLINTIKVMGEMASKIGGPKKKYRWE